MFALSTSVTCQVATIIEKHRTLKKEQYHEVDSQSTRFTSVNLVDIVVIACDCQGDFVVTQETETLLEQDLHDASSIAHTCASIGYFDRSIMQLKRSFNLKKCKEEDEKNSTMSKQKVRRKTKKCTEKDENMRCVTHFALAIKANYRTSYSI